MHRSALLALLLAASVLLFSTIKAHSAPLTANQTIKLADGHQVKILSISKIEYSPGVMALMLRYQTSLSGDEHIAISKEVDDVWKVAQKDVERDGYAEAVLSSNEQPHGIFITASHVWNFIYEKGADGKWTRLNSADFMAQQ